MELLKQRVDSADKAVRALRELTRSKSISIVERDAAILGFACAAEAV